MSHPCLSLEFRSAHASDSGFEPRDGFEPLPLAETGLSIPERFRRIALTRGAAIALVDGEVAVSYRALHEQALVFATAVSARLAGRRGPVFLRLAAGRQAIEMLLGVLFSGRPYCFLDPATTEEEAASMLAAAGAAALVGDESRRPNGSTPVHDLTVRELLDAGRAPLFNEPPTQPHRLACLFATSGSTGTPKLVGLSHQAVLFDVARQINDLCLGPDDRFDLLFAPSFSASLSPIFTALLTGGQLHLLDVRHHLSTLGGWQQRSGITVSTMAVTTFRSLCSSVAAGESRPLPRLISLGGEPLLPTDVALFQQAFPASCVLQNALASTEARTYAQYFVPRAVADEGSVPVGWPVYGKDIVLVDDDGLPVGPGDAGEITIRSRFLADGYVNDDDLTRSRFCSQPDGTVLFSTGDRGRFRDDGCLLYLGRVDSLVKIRGYRVDLAAIDAALARYPPIAHSAVVTHEVVPGESLLAAYVVGAPGATIAADEVREHLARHLPRYAVPSSIAVVDSLPLNRNGKIDRRALQPRRDTPPTPPIDDASGSAAALADAWSLVLGRSRPTPEDHFFDLGGDSLTALRLQMEVHERLGVDMPLDVLVRHPTLEGLAAWLQQAPRSGRETPDLVVLQHAGDGVPLFCVPGIGGEPLQFRPLADHLRDTRPVYGLRMPMAAAADQSIEQLAAGCLAHVDRVTDPDVPVLLCGHSFGGLVAFEMAHQLHRRGRRVGLLAIVDTPLRVGDTRRALDRARDVLANLPAWIRYDLCQSGWHNLAVRTLGKCELAWRRVTARGVGPEPGLNARAYFGILNMPGRFQEVVQARYLAACRYELQTYPGAITLLRARAQALTGRHERHQGWAALAGGGVEVFDVPGHHESCLAEPHARRCAAVLDARIAAVTSS